MKIEAGCELQGRECLPESKITIFIGKLRCSEHFDPTMPDLPPKFSFKCNSKFPFYVQDK